MTDLRNQKRLAADILKCGKSRVRIDADRMEEVSGAVTRSDVRKLVEGGVIKRIQKTGVSRGRGRKLDAQKAKGRRVGPGSRKGAKNARRGRKEDWVMRIRALRDSLRTLRDSGAIDRRAYRQYYMRAKGGQFRSRAHLLAHMKTEGAISEEVEL